MIRSPSMFPGLWMMQQQQSWSGELSVMFRLPKRGGCRLQHDVRHQSTDIRSTFYAFFERTRELYPNSLRESLVRLPFGTSRYELGRCQLDPWFNIFHHGSIWCNQFHPHVFCKPSLVPPVSTCLSAGLLKVPRPSRPVRRG